MPKNLCKKLALDAFYNILQNEQIRSKEFREILILVRQNRQISQKLRNKEFISIITSLRVQNLCKKLVIDITY